MHPIPSRRRNGKWQRTMKSPKQPGYSLVEVVIVVAILSVIAVTGYRCVMYLTKEATQTSRAVTNPQRAQYDRFISTLNDRLGQAWAFSTETSSLPGISGNLLHLYGADGQEFAALGLYTDGTIYQYEVADAGGPAPLDFTYAFTNQDSTWDYALVLTTNATIPTLDVTATWKVPPPLYYRAATAAFRGLFISANDADLEQQVSLHRTNKTGLLQHDLREYNFNPRHDAFR